MKIIKETFKEELNLNTYFKQKMLLHINKK